MKLKNIGNKLFTLFVLLVFVAGTIPLAFAKEDNEDKDKLGLGAIANAEASAEVNTELTADATDSQIETTAKAEVAAETTADVASPFEARVKRCIERVTKNHPKADEKRIEKFCRKHIELKMKINEKISEKKEKFKQKMAEKNKNLDEFRLRALAKMSENNEDIAKFAESLNEKGLDVYAHLSVKARQWCNEHPRECEKRIENWKIEKVKDKKKVLKDKLDKIEEKYLKAKDNFEKAEKNYKEQRNQFSEVKEKLKTCKEDNQTEQCNQLRQSAIDKAKRMAQHSIELLTNHLEKIKERINENENIADDETTQVSTEIDEQIKLLSDISLRVEAAKTKDEIKFLAKKVQNLWRKYKFKAESHALHVANARIQGVVERSEKVEDKFQCVLNQLESEGKDTAEIDALIERYNAKIADARENFTKAKASFNSAVELRTSKNLTETEIQTVIKLNKEGKAYTDAAKTAIKDSHEIVKQIMKAIKENGGNVDSCSKNIDKEQENEEEQEVITENNVTLDQEITLDNASAETNAETSASN
ncbi:hypothetical protein HZA96_02985 [Candidatus Woesearchaeota archaeon]|nr:hypothetical protein [Candidatus Woesearchaeota archaeon]